MCGTAIQENKRTTFDDRTLEVNFSLPEVSDDARAVDEVAVVDEVESALVAPANKSMACHRISQLKSLLDDQQKDP